MPRATDPRVEVGMSVISLGRWRCFLCDCIGEDGQRGFMRHYDTVHLESAD